MPARIKSVKIPARGSAKPRIVTPVWPQQRRKIVDEFARLDREIGVIKPQILRHSRLRELILSWYPSVSGDEEIISHGVESDIAISQRDTIRQVTPAGKQKLLTLWGPERFARTAKIELKSLPDQEDPRGLYTAKARTGPRHLRVTKPSPQSD